MPVGKIVKKALDMSKAVREGQAQFKLGEVLEAPEVYQAFPDMADIPVTVEPLPGARGGEFDAAKGAIRISPDTDFQRVVRHEAQHAIDHRLGRGYRPAETPNGFPSDKGKVQDALDKFNDYLQRLGMEPELSIHKIEASWHPEDVDDLGGNELLYLGQLIEEKMGAEWMRQNSMTVEGYMDEVATALDEHWVKPSQVYNADPQEIRARMAESGDFLLAGVGGAAVLGGAMSAPEAAQAAPNQGGDYHPTYNHASLSGGPVSPMVLPVYNNAAAAIAEGIESNPVTAFLGEGIADLMRHTAYGAWRPDQKTFKKSLVAALDLL